MIDTNKDTFTLTETDPHGNVIKKHVLQMTKELKEAIENVKDLFCECKEPDKYPEYREGYMNVKHGWVCRKCGKFVQIG